MKHLAPTASLEAEWTFVSTTAPCKICGGHDGCRRGFDDAFACCTRRSSEWPLTAGGWVHRMVEVEVEAAVIPRLVRRSDAAVSVGLDP